MADVTYGACCVDDLGSKDLNADLLIHYGISYVFSKKNLLFFNRPQLFSPCNRHLCKNTLYFYRNRN